jgi:hypothetical protein
MFRKLAIALVAVAALSSPSFAFGGGHFGGGGGSHFGGGHFAGGLGRLLHGGRFHGDGFDDDVSDSCYRTIFTNFGPRRVFVCD